MTTEAADENAGDGGRGAEPAPVVTLEAARALAAGELGMLPTWLLAALRAQVGVAAREALAALAARPGRKGNVRKRERAEEDSHLEWRLDREMRERRNTLLRPQMVRRNANMARLVNARGQWWLDEAARAREVEAMPSLTAEQWFVVSRLSENWAHSVAEMVTVAQATSNGDDPLDGSEWLNWTRRDRMTVELARAAEDVRRHERDLRFGTEWAEQARRKADAAEATLQQLRETHEWLEAMASALRVAADLDDDALAVFEAAFDRGAWPDEALARALKSCAANDVGVTSDDGNQSRESGFPR